MNSPKHRRRHGGFTLLEILISVLLAGILATVAFRFLINMQNSAVTQEEISDMQHTCRASLDDIVRNLRQAGFKIPATHNPVEINGDSLAIYYSDTQPVDSILYFLQEYSDAEYTKMGGEVTGMQVYNLMKQVNSNPPEIFANSITAIRFVAVDSANVLISILSQTDKSDESHSGYYGYRLFDVRERVTLRNVTI